MNDDAQQSAEPRILVMRGGAIGDFVLSLPAMVALREQWPRATIEAIGYPRMADLAIEAGPVDSFRSLDEVGVARLFAVNATLPDEQVQYLRSFDFIVSYLYDPGGTVTENLEAAGARQVIYGSPLVDARHAVAHLMQPLEALAIYPRGDERPLVRLPAGRMKEGLSRRERIGERTLAVHAGSGSPSKNWPVDGFLEVAGAAARDLGLAPWFILGEADVAVGEALREAGSPFPVLEACSLIEVAAALATCAAYVGNDSGITHVAAAVNTPTVALFGPSNPELWAPLGGHVQVLRSREPTTESLAELAAGDVLDALRRVSTP